MRQKQKTTRSPGDSVAGLYWHAVALSAQMQRLPGAAAKSGMVELHSALKALA
jgi:hypothetical protein